MKRLNQQKHRMMAALLALLLTASLLLCSCGSPSQVLMRIGKTELSDTTYELLLSRMKGTLAQSGYEVKNAAFWDTIWSTGGATYDDYFRMEILEAAKDMLLRLYLFEEVYDLTLPQSSIDEVDVYMADLLDNDFSSSKSAFNQEMAAYGINMDMLRENYLMEEKMEHLVSYLSTKTADSAREEYYQAHYIRFRQILFPLYEYQYETDQNGDLIYYKKGTNYIAYDTVGGKTATATDGSVRKDADGNPIYYHEDGSIAYDTKNGELKGLDADQDGYVDFVEMTEQEIQNVTTNAQALKELIPTGDFTTFELYGSEYAANDSVWDSYPGGIYLSDAQGYSLEYLNELAQKLKEAKVGDLILFRSESAYHLVMKYELNAGAWGDVKNEDWFNAFEGSMIDELIRTLYAEYADQVVVDESVLNATMSMKEIGTNLYY